MEVLKVSSHLRTSSFKSATVKKEGRAIKAITVKHAVRHINNAKDGIIWERRNHVSFLNLDTNTVYYLRK